MKKESESSPMEWIAGGLLVFVIVCVLGYRSWNANRSIVEYAPLRRRKTPSKPVWGGK